MRTQEKYDSGIKLIYKFVNKVFPEVNREIVHWENISKNAHDPILSKQALLSIKHKKFHAQGGSVFSLYPDADLKKSVKFIVSLQTISDYLDNLCDRTGVYKEESFLQLHTSMLDAVDPNSSPKEYYMYYPYKDDNGYLKSLVEECQQQVRNLPSYHMVLDKMKKYIGLYSEMQSFKHLSQDLREKRLKSWASQYTPYYPELSCWEFSAAAGSTLGIFILFASSFNPYLTHQDVQLIENAYFPWISGLHILLDYYIDLLEDEEAGELNFTRYYTDLKHCEERLSLFLERSLESCKQLPYPKFHATVVKGLISMYLSDPKASAGLNKATSSNLLKKEPNGTMFYYRICKILRAFQIL